MTPIQTISGKLFHEMLVSAANSLENNKQQINDLNVFPVPDGDTGTNMGLTISAVLNMQPQESASDCASKAANAVLLSARGNSGAILALFFRGFAKATKGHDEIDSEVLANAFSIGKEEAYKAVMNPAEGTILTVIRRCAEDAMELKDQFKDNISGFLTKILETAEITLDKTPEMLPILKEAHVVDAGGCGFVTILRGMLAALIGNPVIAIAPNASGVTPIVQEKADFADFNTEDIKFQYCTECIIEKYESFLGEGKATVFYDRIEELGDSIVFVDAEEIVKLHIHTNHPGLVLELATTFGAFLTVKVENMKNQHSALTDVAPQAPAEPEAPAIAAPEKKYGFVSVCMGDGIRDMFADFGVDQIVFGGQTMNPSMQDILDAVNKTPAEIVYVLPNNKNIDMVATQAAEASEEKQVIVIHTKSVPEGISALLSFDETAEADDNTYAMSEAIGHVKSLSVTHAVRDACIDSVAVRS
ncbi:MAG: DAK2 domain-containing protein, partial [Clostridia bacterium]|nr:DAK2 domain-containing protein [Clostridia bacterium]